jgi:uncharacterized protein (TIGR02145 family)
LNLVGDVQAEYLKDGCTESWNDDQATNGTGFCALPAGIVKKCDYNWYVQSAFWTSTPDIFYGFKSESGKILRGNHPDDDCGLSVRCIKD